MCNSNKVLSLCISKTYFMPYFEEDQTGKENNCRYCNEPCEEKYCSEWCYKGYINENG